MTFLDEVESTFGTKNLYEALGLDRDASHAQVKKAYRKVSLKVHPDRVDEAGKELATQKFQTLARIHFVLADEERRKLYDEHGIVSNEDGLDGEADWSSYWRLVFPKITENDIKNFMRNYVGSKEEEEDLIRLYDKYKGDMDKLSEVHISFDEDKTQKQLEALIEVGKIKAFEKFKKQSSAKKSRRLKRAEREAIEAEKLKSEILKKNGADLSRVSDLSALIQSRSKSSFDNMISNLEAKYATKSTKRKRDAR